MTLKNILRKALHILLFTSFIFNTTVVISQEYAPNTLIVKLNPQNAALFSNKKSIKLSDIQIERITPISIDRSKKNTAINRIYKLNLTGNSNSIIDVCKKLESTSFFEYCQPNYYDKILYTPSDPRSADQYTLNLTRALEAWDVHKGDSNIVVGVTDTGVDFNHEDLHDNIAFNVNDPIDGVDNDFDGYVDNYMGWDFGSGDNNPQWNESGTAGNHVHGVFTCGLAGARTDNNIGMASVGFSNKILPIKISDDNGAISTGYESIIYAAQHGCKVINCSWGSTTPHEFGKDVIQYITEDLGVIVVAAAGNDNNENLFYPASYNNVVSVAATGSTDEKWVNSSYNWRVDISAPGHNVLSCFPNSIYGTSSGTSFSSPIVSSALALLLSYYPDTLSNTQIVEILKTSCDYIDTVGVNSSYSNKLGTGRLNLFKALQGNISPSLSSLEFNLLKEGDEVFAGDTAEFAGVITNFLSNTQNVNVFFSSSSEYVEIIDSTFFIPSLNENESINIEDFHLKIVIDENTPNNQNIEFKIRFESDNYQRQELRMINVVFPSIEIDKNRLHTTLFPEGRLAYSSDYRGFGFKLDEQENILYEMGLVAGYSSDNSIANIRYYNDFTSLNYLDSITVNNRWQAFNTLTNSSISPLRINTSYETFDDTLYQNLLLINYQIINTSDDDYEDFYLGIFADWDIFQYQLNYTSIDTSLKLALTHCYSHNEIGGIQLLSHTEWNRYAMDNVSNNGGVYSADGLTRSELYYALSNSNFFEGIENNGTDILDLMSGGPFELNSGDSLNLSFAIIADTSVQNVMQTAHIAQHLYDSLNQVDIGVLEVKKKSGIKVFPNPAKDIIIVDLPSDNNYSRIEIFNQQGEVVHQVKPKQRRESIKLSNLPKGVYIIKVGEYSEKLVLL